MKRRAKLPPQADSDRHRARWKRRVAKVLGVLSVPVVFLLYFFTFPDWETGKYGLFIFAGHSLTLIISFFTILGGMQLLTTLPHDDSEQELVNPEGASIPDSLPGRRSQPASDQPLARWWKRLVRWWLHLVKIILAFTLPSFVLYKLVIGGNEILILISFFVIFNVGGYGLSLLNKSPDDPEEAKKEEEPPRPQLPKIQTKTRDSRQQAQRKLRLMKAVVMAVFGANAFCAGLCSIG